MIDRLLQWLGERSKRERLLLGVAAVLVVTVLGVHAAGRPLDAALERARLDYRAAVEHRAALTTRDRMDGPARGVEPIGAGRLSALVEERAAEKGFVISELSMGDRSVLSVRMAQVRAGPAIAWLSELESRGARIVRVHLSPRGDGTVSADIAIAAQGD